MFFEMLLISVVSFIVLKIRKRKLTILSDDFNIKYYKILIAAGIFQGLCTIVFKRFPKLLPEKLLLLNWIVYPFISFVAIKNINKKYMILFLLGTILNLIAILSNDFKMPVAIASQYANSQIAIDYLRNGKDLIHSLLTENTNFKVLCDIITLAPPYPFVKTISIGDIFLLLGIFAFWQNESEAIHKTYDINN